MCNKPYPQNHSTYKNLYFKLPNSSIVKSWYLAFNLGVHLLFVLRMKAISGKLADMHITSGKHNINKTI